MDAASRNRADEETAGTFGSAESGDDVFHPHDLLWIDDANALKAVDSLPCWASADWLLRAPAVVRRERVADPRLVPVGLRGKTRNERVAVYLDRDAVAASIRPEMLVESSRCYINDHRNRLRAFEALAVLAPSLDATGLAWGPTGSVGFQLASRLPVVREDSDLDIVLRAGVPLSATQTAELRTIWSASICRIDMQVDTGIGAFSFSEWAEGNGRVLLRTDMGPVLTRDPWAADNCQNAESMTRS
jgi:phosphoribosyl-dephospho-CoA transferase